MIDLNKFKERFDKYFEEETVESFEIWLNQTRTSEIIRTLRKHLDAGAFCKSYAPNYQEILNNQIDTSIINSNSSKVLFKQADSYLAMAA